MGDCSCTGKKERAQEAGVRSWTRKWVYCSGKGGLSVQVKPGIGRRLFSFTRQLVAASTTAFIGMRERRRRRVAPDQWARERAAYGQRLGQYILSRETLGSQDVAEEAVQMEMDALIASLRTRTADANINNLTRTEAYLRAYLAHPELHWALLAHLVSRNGGWNMTDLRGDVVGPVLDEPRRRRYFAFLERCNYLIFHDAYPQLLLYEESKRQGRPLFAWLPKLGVSMFMRAAWEIFWTDGEPDPLVIAQIVNEQSFIERRVVKSTQYADIFTDAAFSAQSLFHLVSVIFPAYSVAGQMTGLYGNRVRDFTSWTERIAVGKSLYALLFPSDGRATHLPRRSAQSGGAGLGRRAPLLRDPAPALVRFAQRVVHTGSRADYMTSLFSRGRECKRLYSPTFHEAWPDVTPEPVEQWDWCGDLSALKWLAPPKPPAHANLTASYRKRLLWVQKGAQAMGSALRER